MFRQGKYREAETLAHHAIEIWRRGPPDRRQEDLGYNTLAMIQLHEGNYALALKFIRLALHTYADHGTKDGARLAGYQHGLALIQEGNGDSKGAALVVPRLLGDAGPGKSGRIDPTNRNFRGLCQSAAHHGARKARTQN
jgi:tetratricopeptide (TPR) repeat protein